jgi:peptidoglycan/LPS O-acetylase OafA/YrhL
VLDIIRTLFFIDFNLIDGIFTFTPAWVIALIVYFYIVAPLLIRCYLAIRRKCGHGITFILIVAFAIVSHYLGHWLAASYDIRNIVGYLPLFVFGFFACDLCVDKSSQIMSIGKSKSLRLLIALGILVMFVCASFLYQYRYVSFTEKPLEAYIGSMGVALIILLLSRERASKENSASFLFRLYHGIEWLLSKAGRQAYGIYLWHGITISLFIRSGLLPLKLFPYSSLSSLVETFVVVCLLTWFMSYIFYKILESPYHRLYKERQIRPII